MMEHNETGALGGNLVGHVSDHDGETDWVNPQHYRRGPTVRGETVECIEIVRTIRDYRLATAMKYIWRVGFSGKWDDQEDIRKAMWYLNDFIENPPTNPNWREKL